MPNMRFVSAAFVLCLMQSGLAMAQTDVDVLSLSIRNTALTGVVAITSSDYANLIRTHQFDIAGVETHAAQYELAANANDALALGVTGTLTSNVDLSNIEMYSPRFASTLEGTVVEELMHFRQLVGRAGLDDTLPVRSIECWKMK